MLEKIKLALRIKNDSYNDEINDLIEATKSDLRLAGILNSKLIHNDTSVTVGELDTWESIALTHNMTVEVLKALNADATLQPSAIVYVDRVDTLILRATILYCKANFGLDNPESEKYQAAYESLKNHLCLSTEYTVEAVI